MIDYQQNRPAIHGAADHPERPAIHVSLAGSVDVELYGWVEVGAEEEGVPCRQVQVDGTDAAERAHAAACSSRLGVGISITRDQVAIHEAHMPASQPVLRLAIRNAPRQICRLAGSNAARLVIRVPLRFDED